MVENGGKEQHKYHKGWWVCVLQKIREADMGAVCEQYSRARRSYRRSFAQIMNPISRTRMVIMMAVMKRC